MAATSTPDKAQLMNAAKELNEFYKTFGASLRTLKAKEKELHDNLVAAAIPFMDDNGVVYETQNTITRVVRNTYSLKKLRDMEGKGDLYDKCVDTVTVPSTTLDKALKELDVPAAERDDIKVKMVSKRSTTYRLEHAE